MAGLNKLLERYELATGRRIHQANVDYCVKRGYVTAPAKERGRRVYLLQHMQELANYFGDKIKLEFREKCL